MAHLACRLISGHADNTLESLRTTSSGLSNRVKKPNKEPNTQSLSGLTSRHCGDPKCEKKSFNSLLREGRKQMADGMKFTYLGSCQFNKLLSCLLLEHVEMPQRAGKTSQTLFKCLWNSWYPCHRGHKGKKGKEKWDEPPSRKETPWASRETKTEDFFCSFNGYLAIGHTFTCT